MKKLLMTIILLVSITGVLFAEVEVKLKSGLSFKGDLNKITEDSIFLLKDGQPFQIKKGNIEDVTENGYSKLDFIMSKTNYESPSIMKEKLAFKKKNLLKDTKEQKFLMKQFDDMSEREFQIYLTQIQIEQNKRIENKINRISNTMIGITVGTILGGLIAGLVIAG